MIYDKDELLADITLALSTIKRLSIRLETIEAQLLNESKRVHITPPSAHCKQCHYYDWAKLTERFRDAVDYAWWIPKNTRISAWVEIFQRMHTHNGMSLDRLERLLKWYCKMLHKFGNLDNNNPEYIPIARSAAKFQAKFQELESAMGRYSTKHGLHQNGTAPKYHIGRTFVDKYGRPEV